MKKGKAKANICTMYTYYVSKCAYIKDVYKESYSVRLCKEIRQRAGPFVVFLDLSETAEDQLNEVTKAALAALSQRNINERD